MNTTNRVGKHTAKLLMASAITLTAFSGGAMADGELNLYNWSNYFAPELLERYEGGNRHQGQYRQLCLGRRPSGQAAGRRRRL